MGQCFLYGTGGGGSGVRVVIKAEAPANPRENTVWVKSDTAGKKYVFAEAEPESAEEGMLWLSVTGKGIITAASVYSGGKWVLVDAYMFIGGKWVPIASSWDGTLLSGSNQYTAITGGWGRNANNAGSDNNGWAMYAKNAIDVSGFSKLNIKANFPDCAFYRVGLVSKSGGVTQYGDSSWVAFSQYYTPDGHYPDKNIDVNIDVSSLSGKYYVNVMAFRYGVEYTIDNVSYVKLS